MEERKSRTRQKQEAAAVEDLARELADLSAAAIDSLPAGGETKAEILRASQVREHGARKRQIKYLAKFLRSSESEVVDDLLRYMAGRHGSHLKETAELKSIERLREKILDPEESEAAFLEVARLYPAVDLTGLKVLAGKCSRHRIPRHYREIFRRLRIGAQRAGRI